MQKRNINADEFFFLRSELSKEERREMATSERPPLFDISDDAIKAHIMSHAITLRRFKNKKQNQGEEPPSP